MNSPPPADMPRARFAELLGRSLHDLRNPLSVVRSSLEWLGLELELAERARAEREEIMDAVHDASTATTRILTILEDLAMLSQVESGARLSRGVVDVGTSIGRIASAAHARFAPRGVTVMALTRAPLLVPADARLVERAIEVLVEVCACATPPAGCIELDARIVDVDTGARAVEITIGRRGVVALEGREAAIEALASGGIGVYLALRVFEVHGGSLVVPMTTTVPQTIARLPLA